MLHVTIIDQGSGQPISARCYLTDSNDGFWAPSDAIVYSLPPERHFVSTGEFWILLPLGRYSLRVEHGLECRAVTREIEIPQPGEYEEKIAVARWIDMNAKGWYSGDLHNHRRSDEMSLLLLSEDLNWADTLTQWAPGGRAPWLGAPPMGLEAVHRIDPTHAYSLYDTEFERLGSGPGAMSLIGLPALVTTPGYALAPPDSVLAESGRRQGGFVDAEKIVWKDSAALVALGLVDSAGVVYNSFYPQFVAFTNPKVGYVPRKEPEYSTIAGFPLWALEIYYKFLNCGFRLPVSAGTASGAKPCPLGYCRVYVHLPGAFGYHEWLQGLKAGRSFATNGPVLFLTVNGQEPGETLAFSAGKGSAPGFKVHAEAITAGELDHLDILWKGNVIKSLVAGDDPRHLTADFEGGLPGSGWFAARAFEKPTQTIRFAQTSPVYVQVGDDRGTVPEDARFFCAWMDREIEFYMKLPDFRSEADRRAMLEMFRKARAVYSELVQA
jgi:hypothetical protein